MSLQDFITPDRLVLVPGDPGFEDELAGFQTGFAQRPDVVFAARSADDVAAAVAYAASEGLPVGVQATGHGLPDAAEGGVLITTKRMDRVTVDAATVAVQDGGREVPATVGGRKNAARKS